jgi:hypothetical protein
MSLSLRGATSADRATSDESSDRPTEAALLCCSLRVRKPRDKAIALPKLAGLAVYKLPRFLDCFSLVGAFDALDARKVSIVAKGVNAILVHELHSASCKCTGGSAGASLSHRRLAQGRGQ